jgi:aldehyde dehydrogenase (NAD+)
MPFKSVDEAVELANDTTFGLSGAAIAGSEEKAQEIASRIDAGAVSVMDTALTGTILRDAEKTSFNQSGLGGTRMGPGAIMRFFRKKAIMSNRGDPMDISAFAEELLPQRMY